MGSEMCIRDSNSDNLKRFGGQLKKIYSQSSYFSGFDNNNHYRDSGRSSFSDFEYFLELCYKNNLSLDIVFGPNHVIHWEAFDHSIGLEKWYQWKKDVVSLNEQVTEKYNVGPYRVVDFSIYHEYTMEMLPVNKFDEMKYHWELNHYKSELGDLVLDDLANESTSFGVELSTATIDKHLETQANHRNQYVDSDAYRNRVLIGRERGNLNDYFEFVEF